MPTVSGASTAQTQFTRGGSGYTFIGAAPASVGISSSENLPMAWGMFATDCAPSCGIANMAGTPSNGGSGAVFPAGWAASWLAETDPTNPAWSDGTGTFTTFSAPCLLHWDVMWLELDALGSSGDYASP